MTSFIGAISMRVALRTTLVTVTYYFFSYLLSQPAIKYEIFSKKFIWQIFFFYFIGILDNATFQMIHIFKTTVQHIGACFFTTDATRAIHNDVFVFFVLQYINRQRQLRPKSIRRDFYSIFEMTYFIFIMI